MRLPQDDQTWGELNQDLANHPEFVAVSACLQEQLQNNRLERSGAQELVDNIVSRITGLIYDVFMQRGLVRKRSFPKDSARQGDAERTAASPQLRELRLIARRAEKQYREAVRTQQPNASQLEHKRHWNVASVKCRKMANLCRQQFYTDWSEFWARLQKSSPRKLWQTYRQFTNLPQECSTCSPDTQFMHWSSQGDVSEPVWTATILQPAMEWCENLRRSPQASHDCPPVTMEETEESWRQMRSGKSPGPDGIPSDAIKNLPALIVLMQLLFTLMLHHAVYPLTWGSALLRALLKPEKPKNEASSLRGIRLINSLAAWFGRVLDQRLRQKWGAGPEQFGFRSDSGCSEAVALLIALILSRTLAGQRIYILWVDLRTAFPSLSRPILVKKMCQCGVGLGLCRMMLAILDCTWSIVCVGRFMSKPFKETLGVREGAVESPHAFNMYVGDLRQLEELHPRLCRLMGVVVALLLYADDAAIPADSPEDLQLAASIFEDFCNSHRLFIATAKTFVTVFHPAEDNGVVYEDGGVTVDGAHVQIKVYGAVIRATPTFKYLGVVMNSTCTHEAHFAARCTAFERAAGLLVAGLARLPSASHSFMKYLWTALVFPVACYGMELQVIPTALTDSFQNRERKWWRRLLKVGGRSPNNAVQILMDLGHSPLEWRIRRVSLIVRLANAPAGSWQQLALMAHHNLQTPWFLAACADLAIVLPDVRFVPTMVGSSPYLSSSGSWSDEGEWISILAYSLPRNISGIDTDL